jgi:hypothetical protein
MTYGTEPRYWMYETTGVLRPAVEAYLAGSMSPEQITAMRAYLRQWIDAPVWERNFVSDYPNLQTWARQWLTEMRRDIDNLDSIEAIRGWIVEATDRGMDPI